MLNECLITFLSNISTLKVFFYSPVWIHTLWNCSCYSLSNLTSSTACAYKHVNMVFLRIPLFMTSGRSSYIQQLHTYKCDTVFCVWKCLNKNFFCINLLDSNVIAGCGSSSISLPDPSPSDSHPVRSIVSTYFLYNEIYTYINITSYTRP